MTPVAILLGAGFGLGLILIVAGVRGVETEPRRHSWNRWRTTPRRLALAGLLAVAVGLLTGWPVAALYTAALGAVLPGVIAERRSQQKVVGRVEAIAAWAEMLRDTMAGAAGLEGAIVATGTTAPLAIRSDVRELAAELSRRRIGDALRAFADRLADPTCDLVVAALLMAAENHGRQLGELLSTLARSARDEASMRLRVDAGRARIRGDLQIIVATVVGFVVVFLAFDRAYYAPYDAPLGQLVLTGIGGIFAAAFWLLVRLGGIASPQRLLAHAGGEPR
jgi:Flp pilus assembly protein TadB